MTLHFPHEVKAATVSALVAGGIIACATALGATLPHGNAGRLTFLLLANDAAGAQHVRAAVTMPESDCLTLQAAVWRQPSPTVAHDEAGRPLPAMDAACVPVDQWAQEQRAGARVEP